jgi:hypothetical protein
MGSMQCNVEFRYQLRICSGTKENHGKPGAGPSGCKLTSSEQSGINSVSPKISPYLCRCFIIQKTFTSLGLQIFVCANSLDEQRIHIHIAYSCRHSKVVPVLVEHKI